MKKFLLVVSILTFTYPPSSAQQIDSAMAKYVNDFAQEKIHIHFDKGVYNTGETIWLKGYVLAGLDLSDYSRNFYVDWFSDRGVLIKHTVNPMFESSAKAQFDIPADYTGTYLHVKAYTQWMLNFDTAFLYNKDIRVYQPVLNIAAVEKGNSITGIVASAVPAQAIRHPKTSIHFLPEGGDMLNGVSGRVAFLAESEFGLPVKVIGTIKNNKDELIDSFATEHDGMGSFNLQPAATQSYTAAWTDEYGVPHTTPLPQAKQTGASLEVQMQEQKVIFSVKRNKEFSPGLQKMYVIGHMHQNEVFKSAITSGDRVYMSGQAAVAALPTGVLQITLFDSAYTPLAERVVFVNNHEYNFVPQVRITTIGTGIKEKNTVEIEVDDSLLCNMSVSVTDAGLLTEAATNIASDLLLSGDVKGYIHNPAWYLASDADSVKQFLDLVMLTHGWRRFDWKKVTAGKLPVIKYAKETEYMQLKGTIYGLPYNGALKDQGILLLLQGKDSTKQDLMLNIDSKNNFAQKGIFFYDSVRVYYQITGSKNIADAVEPGFQTGLLPPLSRVYNGAAPLPYIWAYNAADSMLLRRNRLFFTEKEKVERRLAGQQLQTVTVKAKAKKHEDIMEEKYTTGLFSGGDSHQFDLTLDHAAAALPDIFSYLQGRVAGLLISNSGSNVSLSWRGSTPSLFLDEMSADVQMLKNISMNDIAYVKVFSPPFFGASGTGAGGAIAVYTRKGNDTKPSDDKSRGLSSKLVTGYTPYKQFYSPDYSNSKNAFSDDDVRTTLYWSPYILTGQKKRIVKIEFYNNDISNRFRLVLEGVNSEGKLARVEKIIQ